ncbi:MAG: pyrimidine/purine nucleoside phosphorylase [Holophaga sp.]|nr:pyrimidine/purine nucleoside phosphorylase [Holophaga sp.]
MKHNAYFQDKVQSLSLSEKAGPATVGVIEAGKFSFSTASEERMTLLTGAMRVKLPGGEWKALTAGEGFIVPPKVSFEVEAAEDVAYICRYR